MVSLEGGEFVPALGTLHLDLHPEYEASGVVVVVAGGIHEFEGGLEFQLVGVVQRLAGQTSQTDRALVPLPLLDVHILQLVVEHWLK